MRDKDFGHYDPVTFEVMGSGWTEWDYALIQAFQMIEDHTDDNGLLVWEKESDRVEVIAERKIDKFRAAVESRTSGKNYKPLKGEGFIPKLNLLGGEWPTYHEYIQSLIGDPDKE